MAIDPACGVEVGPGEANATVDRAAKTITAACEIVIHGTATVLIDPLPTAAEDG